MNKATRNKNLYEGEEELGILVAQDYRVVQFSPYHFRINEELNVWPTSKKYHIRSRTGAYDSLLILVKQIWPKIN